MSDWKPFRQAPFGEWIVVKRSVDDDDAYVGVRMAHEFGEYVDFFVLIEESYGRKAIGSPRSQHSQEPYLDGVYKLLDFEAL